MFIFCEHSFATFPLQYHIVVLCLLLDSHLSFFPGQTAFTDVQDGFVPNHGSSCWQKTIFPSFIWNDVSHNHRIFFSLKIWFSNTLRFCSFIFFISFKDLYLFCFCCFEFWALSAHSDPRVHMWGGDLRKSSSQPFPPDYSPLFGCFLNWFSLPRRLRLAIVFFKFRGLWYLLIVSLTCCYPHLRFEVTISCLVLENLA